jgi:hypothetical protein
MIHNFPIPLQRGAQGSEERKESNSEIYTALIERGLTGEDLGGDGYFIPEEWKESGTSYVSFKFRDNWISAHRKCVVFETENPEFLKGLDSQLEEPIEQEEYDEMGVN